MPISEFMRRAAGLLVEMPPSAPDRDLLPSSEEITTDDIDLELPKSARPRSVEEIVRDAAGPNLDEIQLDESAVSASESSQSAPDFPAIYRAAGLPEATVGAEKMLETLAALPRELPLETRRATVTAMLGALGGSVGATPQSVVADAGRKIAALDAFVGFMEKRAVGQIEAAQAQIAELEAQIEAQRSAMNAARTNLAQIEVACENEAAKMEEVLAFFGASESSDSAAAPAEAGAE